MNVPSVDLSVAITVFASVAILQALRQTQRVMKQPVQARPRFARRGAPVFLLSCLTLLAPPALTGMIWSRRSPSQDAAAPGLTRPRSVSEVAAFPSGPALSTDSSSEETASLIAAPVPIRSSIRVPTSKREALEVEAPALATEELPPDSNDSKVDEAGQTESGQAESQPDEADSQPEGREDLYRVELPLDPDLPPPLVGQ
ncbi:MAG: hypothetical protein ACRDJF_02745 [Actinomycetota bacterium]